MDFSLHHSTNSNRYSFFTSKTKKKKKYRSHFHAGSIEQTNAAKVRGAIQKVKRQSVSNVEVECVLQKSEKSNLMMSISVAHTEEKS